MKIINLTGHDINIVSQIDGQRTVTHTFPSEGCARVSFETKEIDSIDGVKIFKSVAGQTQGLPEQVKLGQCNCRSLGSAWDCCAWNGDMESSMKDEAEMCQLASRRFIVSKIVAEANPHRNDLLIVHETVREGAIIIGCKGLATLN